MQAQRIDSVAARERGDRDELDSAQGALLAVLLSESHHGLYSRDELQRTLSAEPLTVADAIAELIASGLAHDLGGFVLASQAARSFDRLDL